MGVCVRAREPASEPQQRKSQQIFNRIRLSHAIEFFSLSIENECVRERPFIFFHNFFCKFFYGVVQVALCALVM